MKQPNDQVEIIELLKQKNYTAVWEKIKSVGYKDVADIHERFLIFYKAALKFNPYRNNNFILFYKNYLKGYRIDQDETFRVSTSRNVIKKLKEQSISPSKTTKFVQNLQEWNN